MTDENNRKSSNCKSSEEAIESLLSVEDSQTLSNVYVIIGAIENYPNSEPKGK